MSALQGKTIIVTRASHQAASMLFALEELGATALHSPAIAIETTPGFQEELESHGCLENFDWLMVTSQNGVKALAECGYPTRDSLEPSCAVVGPKTEQALMFLGYNVQVTANPAHSAELLAEMAKQPLNDKRVLLLQGNQAPTSLAEGLRALGAEVICLEAYRTVAGSCQKLAEFVDQAEAVLFTSGTTARYSLEALANDPRQERFKKLKVFSIGPKTTCVLNALGFVEVVEAQVHTMDGLIAAVTHHYQSGSKNSVVGRDHDK
ncbi:MAG: uroporphyrinogen-III synthase [Planctomycetota bacterium]|nr:uroporphyrinogen-III synthase [Planctomycetota bacterium]